MKNELIQMSRDHWDYGDLWGSAMSTYFDCCDELTSRGAGVDPVHGYRPGAGGPQGRDEYSDCGLIDWDAVADETIEQAAEILRRYTSILDKAGMSY